MNGRPIIVGELNPYGAGARFALYPFPENSAGGRLCRIVLGMRPGQYVDTFERVNLCTVKWSLRAARKRADELLAGWRGRTIVLLGRRAAQAMGEGHLPLYTCATRDGGGHLVLLPHPSGRCREWNVPGAVARARLALAFAGVIDTEKAREAIAAARQEVAP
jgi:hypothetical protein